MTKPRSLPPAYFEKLYAAAADPWGFETSAYERAKSDATLAALPRRQFPRALEVGCSIGVLTRRLAEHCASLLAVDVAEAALARARARCVTQRHVVFRRMRVPGEWPDGQFALILFSEVLYYLSPPAIAQCAARVRSCLAQRGAVLLVHYILPTDYPCSGDAAAEAFIGAAGLTVTRQQRELAYRLDLLQG